MQGLILAAGMGTRLGKYTANNTKCMVKVNGKTLIERVLDQLIGIGIRKTIIVIGYKGDILQNFIGKEFKNMEIIYIENDIYDKTNNIYSLWLAKQHLINDDTLLIESDIIFDEIILEKLIKNPNPNLAVVAPFEVWMDGTVTILDDKDNIISFLPKKSFNWDDIKNYYKTVNIYKFSRDFSEKVYIPFLEAYVKARGNNEYYEQVLRVITYLDGMDFKAFKLNHEKWYEIDDTQDLDIAEVLFADDCHKLNVYQKRYGGYWRFPKLKDFCYLVNPFFPNENMISEFKSTFFSLLTQYPSTLYVQNLLAGKLFDCDQDKILVGNGATELIKIVINSINGNIGVIAPTFNEYPERIGKERLKYYIPQDKDYQYSINELKQFATDLSCLVLINPDNPSGHYFNQQEVLELTNHLKKSNTFLILDESFIDFSGDNAIYSLTNNEVLREYQNLIVIKSLSKCYGVPGLRLGVLACGNFEMISAVKKDLPIWNINSFAEYFLQIIGKYKSEYKIACNRLSFERERFFKQLSQITYLRVIPSKSNYFLCEVISNFTATELTNLLLLRYGILIKDCTGKKGFEDKNYVRIAIRDQQDNEFIFDKLFEIQEVYLSSNSYFILNNTAASIE